MSCRSNPPHSSSTEPDEQNQSENTFTDMVLDQSSGKRKRNFVTTLVRYDFTVWRYRFDAYASRTYQRQVSLSVILYVIGQSPI